MIFESRITVNPSVSILRRRPFFRLFSNTCVSCAPDTGRSHRRHGFRSILPRERYQPLSGREGVPPRADGPCGEPTTGRGLEAAGSDADHNLHHHRCHCRGPAICFETENQSAILGRRLADPGCSGASLRELGFQFCHGGPRGRFALRTSYTATVTRLKQGEAQFNTSTESSRLI